MNRAKQGDAERVLARLRSWDPIIEAIACAPISTREQAMSTVILTTRLERACQAHDWDEAERLILDLAAEVARANGGLA